MHVSRQITAKTVKVEEDDTPDDPKLSSHPVLSSETASWVTRAVVKLSISRPRPTSRTNVAAGSARTGSSPQEPLWGARIALSQLPAEDFPGTLGAGARTPLAPAACPGGPRTRRNAEYQQWPSGSGSSPPEPSRRCRPPSSHHRGGPGDGSHAAGFCPGGRRRWGGGRASSTCVYV